ncbi:MAG: cell surface protein SprA, partial [Bacteroidota bacterium]
MNFIEIWMRVDSARVNLDGSFPKMRIDLGSISEDVIPNRQLNSEDLVISSTPNGTLQEGEDVGLDMIGDAGEVARYGSQFGTDPSGDDYAYNNNVADFSRINGTENNKNSPNGLIPDTEDLNSNGIVDLVNQYMQYEVSLDTSALRNPRVVGGGNKGWYQFRIPIREYSRLVGGTIPNFENVENIRLTFLNASHTVAVRIADFSLVGNQWQELRKDDSTFAVTVVSVEDNAEYESPPGVIRERDKTRPDEEVLANEQSLALILKGVPGGHSRQAVKYYTYRPLDLFNYRQMKMFVHGDATWATLPRRPQAFYRFGLDSLNYYEYRGPIYPGWDARNEILIKFSELTAIKQLRDSVNQAVTKIARIVDGDTVM